MPYCTRSDIEDIYGASNVEKWADMDNNHNHTRIAARIDKMCEQATAEIDARLRNGPYAVPFIAPLDPVIVDMAARWAAYLLYMGRPQDEDEPEGGHNVRGVLKVIDRKLIDIRAGRLRLNVSSAVTWFPQVVD